MLTKATTSNLFQVRYIHRPHVSTYISNPRGIARFVLVLQSEQNCLQIAISNICASSAIRAELPADCYQWHLQHVALKWFLYPIYSLRPTLEASTALELTIQNFWNISHVAKLVFPDVSTKHGPFTFRTASILKPIFLWAVKYIPAVNDVALPDHKRQRL